MSAAKVYNYSPTMWEYLRLFPRLLIFRIEIVCLWENFIRAAGKMSSHTETFTRLFFNSSARYNNRVYGDERVYSRRGNENFK